MRLKKILEMIVIISAFCMMLCACEGKKQEDIFIISGSNGADMNREEFKAYSMDAAAYGLVQEWDFIEDDSVEKIKKIKQAEDKEYEYIDTRVCTNVKDINENTESYNIHDNYEIKDENGKLIEACDFLRGLDFMCCYVNMQEDTGIYIGTGDVESIAEGFLLQLMSEEEFSKYTYLKTEYEKYSEENIYRCARYIEGYKTDDQISVSINKNGVIKGYSANFFSKYDALIDKLTKEKLDVAKEKLETKIAETFNIDEITTEEPCIITNTSGEPYMKIRIIDETTKWAYSVMTPIE